MKDSSLPPPPVELLELATAYQRAKTLFPLVETGLPTRLARGLARPSPRGRRQVLQRVRPA
ncbi:MAG: hypothetical protein M3379_03345, partial [Acidobacteriota bacterium]|nr:hypothetical protein [Acidobacteriota bacterium]